MGFLDELKLSAKNVVDFAEKKTDSVVELSKLKYQQVTLGNELDELMNHLGEAVYTMVKANYDNKDLVNSLIAEIDEVKASLQAISEKLAAKKDQILCPACNAANDKNSNYCCKCGNKLEVVKDDVVVEETCDEVIEIIEDAEEVMEEAAEEVTEE